MPVCTDHVPDELGITYRQLDCWSRAGYLKPGRQASARQSPGNSRTWTPGELQVARLMGRLTAAGLQPQAAARIARSGARRTEISAGIWVEISDAGGGPGAARTRTATDTPGTASPSATPSCSPS